MRLFLLILSVSLFYVNGNILNLTLYRCSDEVDMYATYTIWFNIDLLAGATNDDVKDVATSSMIESFEDYYNVTWDPLWCLKELALVKRDGFNEVACLRRLIAESDEEYQQRRRLCTRRRNLDYPGAQFEIIYGVNQQLDDDIPIYDLFNQSNPFLDRFALSCIDNGIEAGIIDQQKDVNKSLISIGSNDVILNTTNYFCNADDVNASQYYTLWFYINTDAEEEKVQAVFTTALIRTIRKFKHRWDPSWCFYKAALRRREENAFVPCVRRLGEMDETRRRLCTRRLLVDEEDDLEDEDEYQWDQQFQLTYGVSDALEDEVLGEIFDGDLSKSLFLIEIKMNFLSIATYTGIISVDSDISDVTEGIYGLETTEGTITTTEGGESPDNANTISSLFVIINAMIMLLLN